MMLKSEGGAELQEHLLLKDFLREQVFQHHPEQRQPRNQGDEPRVLVVVGRAGVAHGRERQREEEQRST